MGVVLAIALLYYASMPSAGSNGVRRVGDECVTNNVSYPHFINNEWSLLSSTNIKTNYDTHIQIDWSMVNATYLSQLCAYFLEGTNPPDLSR